MLTSPAAGMKRILVYNPYLPVLGGGERYTYFLAQALRNSGEVVIGGPSVDKARLEALGFDTSIPRIDLAPQQYSEATRDFDLVLCLTNEIPRGSYAPESILVVQFPYEKPASWRHPRARLRQQRSLASYDQFLVYSEYSQNWTKKKWGVKADVLAPPVTLGSYRPESKRPIILAVGRFFTGGHSKRQDLLVDAFIELEKKLATPWQLVLVGGCYDDPSSRQYLSDVREKSAGHQIEILQDLPAPELLKLYESASLFWHGAGYGRSKAEPQNAEHFGMTTVEAMSYGAVPLVYADGGQVELVGKPHGRLWRTVEELVSQTIELVEKPNELEHAAVAAVAAAEKYSFDNFAQRLTSIIKEDQ
jgi:glycosyltransferase involved in cell wall biosynthesis